jgi:hypothetical protein
MPIETPNARSNGRPAPTSLAPPIKIARLGEYHPGDRCAWCGLLDSEAELRPTILKHTRAHALECVDLVTCLRGRCRQRDAS